MASEELNQRYKNNKGKKIGNYELFETQLTTLKQYSEHNIIPQKNYGNNSSQKPDLLIINRVPDINVILIGEMKGPGIIKSSNWKKIADDLLLTKCKPTEALIGIISDREKTHWINGKANEVIEITREDNQPMPQKLDFSNQAFLTELEYIINNFDHQTSKVLTKIKSNPDNLAKEVWQTVWRLKADSPEDCLATFIEIFIFKFLDDLKLLKNDSKGNNVSLEYVMTLDKDKTFKYYFENIRPFIKQLFPPGEDGYSIINGIVLQHTNVDHNIIFHEILNKFIKFGKLTNTDTDFKRRLYESFLKQSKTVSSFGQFFTPRAIVSAIHDMAEIDNLSSDKQICDPASGVGGFILEQMARDLSAQWELNKNTMKCIHKYYALEKISKTSILAKANALVHCGDYLSEQPSRIKSFSKWLNDTFKCYDDTALGSLKLMYNDKFDLIITNPPYVVSGSKDFKKIIQKNSKVKKYYNLKCSGVEGLFIQFIIKSLKNNGDAWILLPESYFLRTPDNEIRNWMIKNCQVKFIVLLPERVFYNTPKKVCIVNLKKRKKAEDDSTILNKIKDEKTLIYAVSEIGETRDSKRFPCQSDLPDMINVYKEFKGNNNIATLPERAVITASDKLYNIKSLNIRQFYNKNTAIKLGLLSSIEDAEASQKKLNNRFKQIKSFLIEFEEKFNSLKPPEKPREWIKVKLGDKKLFDLKIGKRVLKTQIRNIKTQIPIYSANIRKPFGYVATPNAGNLKYGGCLWSIDSDWDCRGIATGEQYSITDHCGEVKILMPNINSNYLARQIRQIGIDMGFNREFRPSLNLMKNIEIDLPILKTEFNINAMQEDSMFYEYIENISSNLNSLFEEETCNNDECKA